MKHAGKYLNARFEFFGDHLVSSDLKKFGDLGHISRSDDDVDFIVQRSSLTPTVRRAA